MGQNTAGPQSEALTERIVTSQEDLDAAWVGGPPPPSKPVVVDYDPDWPARYHAEAQRIRDLLGDQVLEIEHVGSTAVPGLAAKDIIDIDLVVADSADEGAYLPTLEAAAKRELAARHDDVRDYSEAKNDIIDDIYARAFAADPDDDAGRAG